MLVSNTSLFVALIILGVVAGILSIGLFIFCIVEIYNSITEIKDRKNRRNRRNS